MAKAKTAYVCADCGAEYPKWQGQCDACGAWNTLSEFVVQPAKAAAAGGARNAGYAGAGTEPPRVQLLAGIAGESVKIGRASCRERV